MTSGSLPLLQRHIELGNVPSLLKSKKNIAHPLEWERGKLTGATGGRPLVHELGNSRN
jgi:hypothetical protein